MSYFDHFKELRNRLIFCFIFLISIFIISFFYSEKITNILTFPLYDAVGEKENKRMIFTGLPEVFVSYLKISLFYNTDVTFYFTSVIQKRKKFLYTFILFYSFLVLCWCFIFVFFFNSCYMGFFCVIRKFEEF